MTTLGYPVRVASKLIAIATIVLGSQQLVAQTVASIPAGMEGTYTLTFGSAQQGAPLVNGDTLNVVLSSGGTLCIDKYILGNPVLEGSNTAEAVWHAPAVGVKLALSNINTGTFNELNVFSSSNQFLGQLTGT
ncbi:MAG: hypothetical protein Q8M35_02110, partial [Pseudohongiella sp.]|nr:hypothetical protein [Pseudohongiella sp.]